MKNGKKPTRQQKVLLKTKGLLPENWLVIKDTSQYMEVVSRTELKKIGKRKRTRKLWKDESSLIAFQEVGLQFVAQNL